MFLSDEQERAVKHGYDFPKVTWHEIDLPAGPRHVPDWCRGVHIRWNDEWGSSPSILLKTTENVRDWPDQRFEKDGAYYRARHEDGRMKQYAHDGQIGTHKVRMFRRSDGSEHPHRRHNSEKWPDQQFGYEPGEWVDVDRRATSQQQGFCGQNYHITLLDGSDLVLRGPWHVGAPSGYVEVAYTDTSRPCFGPRKRKRPWYDTGGIGGLYLSSDLFIRIMSRFAAHLRLAEITVDNRVFIEPMKPEWSEPKLAWYYRKQRERG